MKEWDDEKLVRCAMRGNRRAYGILVDRYTRLVFGLCLSKVGSPSDAEDLAQEVFMKGYLKIMDLADLRRSRSWLLRICGNQCTDYLRSRQRECNHRVPVSPEVARREETVSRRGLDMALGRLPEKYRLPLILYYLDGRDTHNVAVLMGITPAGVLTRLCRARQRLRDTLTREGDHA